MSRQFVTTASLVMVIGEGLSDQEAFNQLNKTGTAMGINFVFPANTVTDRPVIIVHVDKTP